MGSYDHNTPSPFAAHVAPGNFSQRLTFEELCDREPRLAALRDEIARLPRRSRGACANALWFATPNYKRILTGIIGHLAVQFDPDLRTSAAYDVAYQSLYRLLPNCQHDGICRWQPVRPLR